MNTIFNADDALLMLERLNPPSGQFLELRVIFPTRSSSQFYCWSAAEALRVIKRFSGTANVYVGACPRSVRNGRRDAVTTVIGAWADLDFHQIDPTNRDVALEIAHRDIDALGLPPAMLVHTGNGLQAWWLFNTPMAITDDWPAERFESINLGLAKRLGGDYVHDLARVLRVPGTMNLPDAKKRARGCVPVMARLLHADGPTYRPDDFASLMVESETSSSTHTEARRPRLDPVDTPDDEEVASFEDLLHRLGPHHPLTRTWEGRRRLRDSSRSGFDWALALQCARVGVKPDFAAALMRIYNFGKGPDGDDAYVHRTIARAYAREVQRRAS